MICHESSKSNHGQPSIFQLLHLEVIPGSLVSGPELEVVNRRIISSKERLALHFFLVLKGFEDSTNEKPLGPPLRIGLEDGIDGVGGGNVGRGEGSEYLREEPADSGKHGRATVGEFGTASPVNGKVITESQRVKLMAGREES